MIDLWLVWWVLAKRKREKERQIGEPNSLLSLQRRERETNRKRVNEGGLDPPPPP